MAETINRELIRLARRAEARPSTELTDTYVDVGALYTRLSADDHQVIYGRRGTGKTHALWYLNEDITRRGQVALYIDMRTLGSSGGIYSDPALPMSERGTRLLVDTLEAVHKGLRGYATDDMERRSRLLVPLDELAEAATQTRVSGGYEYESSWKTTRANKASTEVRAELSTTGPRIAGNLGDSTNLEDEAEVREKASGTRHLHVHFGAVHHVLRSLIELLPDKRLWIILDEWSSIPMDLQPVLADLIRRSMLPVPGMTIKIGAIEDRSRLQERLGTHDYIGLELGTDISADLDLDDYLSFGRDPRAAREFYAKLFHKHLQHQLPSNELYGMSPPSDKASPLPKDAISVFVNRAFGYGAFDELAQSGGGIPRDTINIASYSAQQAVERLIGRRHVATAAREWYLRDKERAIAAHQSALDVLRWLVDEIAGKRHSTAFFLRQGGDADHSIIRYLYYGRVLHILHRSAAANDEPGARYVLFGLDYGSYVDTGLETSSHGLFRADIEGSGVKWVDHPVSRYESIEPSLVHLQQIPGMPHDA